MYPAPLGAIQHGISFAIFECCAHAKRKKVPDNLSLSSSCLFRAASAPLGVLHCKVKGHGPGLVPQRRITPRFEKAFYGSGTSRTNSAVQRSSAILVLGIDVSARVEQAADGLHLPFGIPRGAIDVTIRCVVQRAAMTMVSSCVWVGSGVEQ